MGLNDAREMLEVCKEDALRYEARILDLEQELGRQIRAGVEREEAHGAEIINAQAAAWATVTILEQRQRAALALHAPEDWSGILACSICTPEDGYGKPGFWPCDTALALDPSLAKAHA